MLGHYALKAPEQTLKKDTENAHPQGNFFGSDLCGNTISEQTCQCNHYSSKKTNGKKAFSKNFDNDGKIKKGNRWFKVPKLGVGQMSVYPRLSHQDESALIAIHIIPKKEWETNKDREHDQNKEDRFPVQILIPKGT